MRLKKVEEQFYLTRDKEKVEELSRLMYTFDIRYMLEGLPGFDLERLPPRVRLTTKEKIYYVLACAREPLNIFQISARTDVSPRAAKRILYYGIKDGYVESIR